MVIERLIYILLIGLISCTSWNKVKSGSEAYEYKKYALAIDMLESELTSEEDIRKRLFLARSYDHLGYYEKARESYTIVLERMDDDQIMLEYGRVLKKLEDYDGALNIFQMLKTEVGLDPILNEEVASCLKSMDWMAQPDTLTQVTSLSLNSRHSEYGMTRIDGQWVFTSDRSVGPDSDVYDWTGRAYSNLWYAQSERSDVELWNDKINSDDNEGMAVLHPNGQEVYFTRCRDEGRNDVFCHIYHAKRNDDGTWKEPVLLTNINGNYNSRHSTFSQDGLLMFYSSDESGGLGGYDIFYAQWDGKVWQKMGRLSQMVNTEKDEVFPMLKGDTLFFSSNGHAGMGGLDFFKTFFSDNDQWVKPINLGTPMNSGADDFALYLDTITKRPGVREMGFFASNRKGGQGADDLYEFIINERPKDKKEDEAPWLISVKVLEPIYNRRGDPNSGVRKYTPLEGVEMTASDWSVSTDITGLFTREVDSLYDDQVELVKEGFFTEVIDLNMADASDRLLFLKVVMKPIFYGKEINLANIYYDFNKWDIREGARPSLDSLAALLKNNPDLDVKLSSHTDCRGEDDFNMELSQKRAESVVQYLIQKGISPQRLTPEGKGETVPFVPCECATCTEEEHQANRRTTFEIMDD